MPANPTDTSALDLNASAVFLLEQGMCHEASSFFLRAIQHFTDSIEAEHRRSPPRPNDTCNQQGRCSIRVTPIAVLGRVSTLEVSFSPGNAFEFYNKSYLIDLSDVIGEEDYYSRVAQDQLAAILWYNWGVTYHFAAITRGRSKYLEKALELYTNAFRILLHSNIMVDDSMTLLLLSVSNNMGYCSHHFSDAISSRCFHEYIHTILENYGNSGCFVQEYDFFFSPTTPKSVMSIAPAA